MITLVEGVIGSGKTYFVVFELLRKYFRWDENEVRYIPLSDDVEIYTNIDGFVHGKSLTMVLSSVGGVENFFTVPVQEKLTNSKRHVYVIDEAQMYFGRKFYNKPVFDFFQWSRHFGIDMYLITQDVYSLVRELQNLNEHHIKVVRRSYSMLGEFRYNFMSGYDVIKRKTLRADPKVFKQFRSTLTEGEGVYKYESRG